MGSIPITRSRQPSKSPVITDGAFSFPAFEGLDRKGLSRERWRFAIRQKRRRAENKSPFPLQNQTIIFETTNTDGVRMSSIKLHPALNTKLQIEMIQRGLIPAHAFHMHTSDFLNELPANNNQSYLGSNFQLHMLKNYEFRMFDLCGMLYSTFLTANDQYERMDENIESFKSRLAEQTGYEMEEENLDLQISASRARVGFRSLELHLNEIANFASQGFAVQLWAFNEKHLSQLLQLFGKETGISFNVPYRWDDVTKTLKDLNIDIVTLPTASASYNELRVLNNKIKHLGEVDSALAEFGSFNGKEGTSIDDLTLDLQRYLDASYAVLTFIAEQLAQRVSDATFKAQLLLKPKYQLITT